STESQLSFALQEFSMYLRQYYKKQCIVLIDEYDSPMECAYNKGYYEVANEFFKGMFSSLLKSNDENVAKAMLVGVLRIAKSGFLSGLNNITIYPFHQENYEDSSPLYVDKFGFTSDEVELLLSLRKNLQINDVQKWYDGYISGGSTHLYNPWSIIRLLSRGILCAYWTDTGSTQTLEKCLWRASCSFKESVEKLLKGESITNTKVQDDLRYLHLDQCQDLAIWTLLYYAGYLTMNSEKYLVIPNKEIRSEWHNWVTNVPFFTHGQTITSMLNNLLLGNLDLFSKEFKNMIVDTLSFYDVSGSNSGKNAENIYHAFCLGVFANARDRGFIVHSNREDGFERFKVVRDKKTLHDMAQEGLTQIEEKQYRVGLEKHVKKLLEIGIAFEGKKACVLGHLLHRTEEGAWNKDYESLISD
ncbi:13672_t:CDS:2, partial [Racocetra persica]